MGGRRQVLAGQRSLAVLAAMIGVYVAVFGFLTWRHHANFGTAAFDMAIYDQGLWLLSRFRDPFVTVRGLDYFGHHGNYATVLLVPAYWLGAGPHFLYLFETVVLALGAVPVWLLGRDRLGDEWLGLCIAAAYLLYPAVQWINWWHFHPDALLTTQLLFACWAAARRRWGWFAVAAALAALTKEDAALALAAFGVVLLVRRAWRPGAAIVVASIAWFLVVTRVLIPRANGDLPPFYDDYFPGYGSSFGEVAWNMLRHPSRLFRDLTEHSRLYYFAQLLAPLAFVPLLGVPVLLLAVPQLVVNSIADNPFTHDIRFHYSAIPVAGMFVAAVEGCRRVAPGTGRSIAVGLVVVASVAGQVAWGPSPMGRAFDDGYWKTPRSRAVATMRFATEMVPPGVGVSATSHMLPHLAHRPHAFVWPHPFEVVRRSWGARGSKPPDPDSVDYVVVDLGDPATYATYRQSESLFARLTGPSGSFEVVYQGDDGIFVAKRR